MKKYYTHSDGGCFLFGNKDFSFKIYNGYGDCRNTVLVFDDEKEYLSYCKEKYGEKIGYKAFESVQVISGVFNLYNYDCSSLDDEDIKAKFNGKYDVYLRNASYESPTLAIVKRG